MALRGTLRSFPPTEILQFLTHSRKSGTLRVHDETDTKLLSFSDGKLVYAVHQRVFPRLSDVLIHRGLADSGEIPTDLNAHRWDEAMSRALARRRQLGKRLPENRRIEKLHRRSEDARLGHILVAQGRLSKAELELATMPHNIPDALLESILIASELL